MNKILYFLLLFSIISNSLHAQARKLRGVWKMQTVDGKVPDGPDKNIQLRFYNNGDFEFTEGERTDNGKWTLLDDKKTIQLDGLEMGPSEKVTIVEISKKSVSLDNEGSVAVFEKIGKTKKRKKNKPNRKLKKVAKNLHGSWKVIEVVGIPADLQEEMPEIFMQFNKDGSLLMQEPNRTVAGSWKMISAEQLSLNFDGREELAMFEFKKDTLEISDQGRAGFRLVRSDKKLKASDAENKDPLVEEPFDPEPDVVVTDPLFSTKDVAGSWKISTMDGDDMQERNIQMNISEDGKFEIIEDGESIRKGSWEFNKQSQLYIKDTAGYSNKYTIKLAKDNKIMLFDYYGEIEMIRK